MSFHAAPWLGRCALLLVMLVGLLEGGCSPDAFLTPDEDRERNFQRARAAERLGDYEGAAEFYERAIEKNPRSAAVHLGYASLCEGSLRRHADAVYHYQRYLKLRADDPKDPKAEAIRRRITNCTEQLATSVPLVIRSETIARELATVRGENQELRRQVTQLLSGVAHWSNEWARASLMLQQAQLAGNSGTPRTGVGAGVGATSGRITPLPTDRSASRSGAGSSARRPYNLDDRSAPSDRSGRSSESGSGAVAGLRTHRVARGETMAGIARVYGVSIPSLQRANAHVRPRTMPVGTVLRIPDR
ncbi:MAG: tetratricopeptide repeat protein [Limisphaerales bacterium]